MLVIGATGRVGRVLCPKIDSAGPAQFLVTGSQDAADQSFLDTVPKATYRQLRLPDDIGSIPKDFDYVVVLAGVAKPQAANDDPFAAIVLNVESFRRIVAHFESTNTRIVVASTVSTSSPNSAYAATKIAVENLAIAFSTVEKPIVTVVRLGNMLKTSGVINTLLRSLTAQGSAEVHSSSEFFQPTPTIPYTFEVALRPEAQAGDIFTHLMFSIPIPFLAGVLAGAYIDEVTPQWNPPYARKTANPPFLLPEWWWPYTEFVSIDRAPGDIPPETTSEYDKKVIFLKTNLRRRSNVGEGADTVKATLEDTGNAEFGRFIDWLRVEELLPKG